ncbi:MAG: hypothetical protein U9R79_14150 [Armatimonadota bacterium]|nr:hypothetical protein [Armatimonadota bacterium]
MTQQGILWSIAAIFLGLLIAEFLFIKRGPIHDYVAEIAGGRDAEGPAEDEAEE